MQQGYQAYKRVRLETAEPPQLLLALYDGAIRFLRLAQTALERSDIEAAHTNLLRTQDILFELMSTLDMKRGEIPQRLMDLYVYLYRTLAEANAEKNATKIAEVEGHLRRLREAWRGAIRTVEQTAPRTSPQAS